MAEQPLDRKDAKLDKQDSKGRTSLSWTVQKEREAIANPLLGGRISAPEDHENGHVLAMVRLSFAPAKGYDRLVNLPQA